MMMTHKVFIYKSFFCRQNRNSLKWKPVVDSKLCVLIFCALKFCFALNYWLLSWILLSNYVLYTQIAWVPYADILQKLRTYHLSVIIDVSSVTSIPLILSDIDANIVDYSKSIVRQLMYEMSMYITIIVTFRYTMQSNHQINN